MTRYAVLLRGVNVGGNNKVPMARLRELAADLGYREITTYVQSGNLVVTAEAKQAAALEKSVADIIREELGVDIAVMVRSRKELATALDANPFAEIADDPARMVISFLASQPAADKRNALDRNEFAPELFEFGDRCLYLWYPAGMGRSKMSAAPWDRRLGVRGTGRNVRTIAKLVEMLDGAE